MKAFKVLNGDLVLDSKGELQTLSGQDYLDQAVEKILLTGRSRADKSRPDPDYGASLNDLARNPPASPVLRALEAKAEIRRALEKLIEIQTSQYEALADKTLYPAEERLARVLGLQVWVPDDDPRELQYRVHLMTKADELITEGRTMAGAKIGE